MNLESSFGPNWMHPDLSDLPTFLVLSPWQDWPDDQPFSSYLKFMYSLSNPPADHWAVVWNVPWHQQPDTSATPVRGQNDWILTKYRTACVCRFGFSETMPAAMTLKKNTNYDARKPPLTVKLNLMVKIPYWETNYCSVFNSNSFLYLSSFRSRRWYHSWNILSLGLR